MREALIARLTERPWCQPSRKSEGTNYGGVRAGWELKYSDGEFCRGKEKRALERKKGPLRLRREVPSEQ